MNMPFVCSECGYRSVKWYGRCPNCGAWDSLVEESTAAEKEDSSWLGEELRAITKIDLTELERIPSGFPEFDRLLGGGLVPGGVILFGGEPGIGKSTLLLQLADSLAGRCGKVLYVSGEESGGQVKLRADRLGIESDELFVLSEQALGRISAAIERLDPSVLIIDSIQTVKSPSTEGVAGSLRQLRAVSSEIAKLAKARGMATFLVGHITKEGAFAGPKTVEHLVDAAVYMEGSRAEDLRIIRSVKNRFGATNEVAVFKMTEGGLREVDNPSGFFLDDIGGEPRPGTAVVPILEGTRPILVEIQSLVSPTGGYGIPQRRCTGLDVNRVLLLLAVIDKRLSINVSGADVYLSIAGGLEVRERGTDLGVIAAIVSSLRDRPIKVRTALVGEVGLAGEIRPVRRLSERIREADKMGYERIIVPSSFKGRSPGEIDVTPVDSIERAIAELELD